MYIFIMIYVCLLVPFADLECADGWTLYEGLCYQHFPSPKQGWDAAKASCEAVGGSLAVVRDAGLLEFLSDWLGKR